VIVLDASFVIEMLLGAIEPSVVESRILRSDVTLHVPHLLDIKVVQALRRYVLASQMQEDRARQGLEDLHDLPLRRYSPDFLLPRVWELRHKLTAYDAVYVALAEALRAPLLTRDARLVSATGHDADVELV
jgi:predicted nucleic acid-binding protein